MLTASGAIDCHISQLLKQKKGHTPMRAQSESTFYMYKLSSQQKETSSMATRRQEKNLSRESQITKNITLCIYNNVPVCHKLCLVKVCILRH